MKGIVTATTLAALVLSACAVPARSAMPIADSKPVSTSTTIAGVDPSAAPALMPFDACKDLLGWTARHALERVGPYGLDGYGVYPRYDETSAVRGEGDASFSEDATTTAAASAAQEKIDVIGTNLQEIGVDEPDIVKTDGDRIVAVSGSTLFLVSVDGERLDVRGSLDLAFWTQDLFLDGDRVIAIANGGFDPMPLIEESIEFDVGVIAPQTAVLTVTEIDISDLDDPELTRTLRIDGRYVSSRMVDGAVRLVVSSGPTGFSWAYPDGGGLRAERTAEERNREIIEQSKVENWLPYFIVTDHRGRDSVAAEGTLLTCDRTHRPRDFSGFTTLSLVTLGTAELDVADATGVFADGEIVYSSGDATYVATNQWIDPFVFEETGRPESTNTMIHKFDLSTRGADYQASGTVSGYMLSQWSMSEHNGYLRVASTDTPEWWDGPNTESMVTVLDTAGRRTTKYWPCRRPWPWRAHLFGAVLRRHGLCGHLSPGRSALRHRSVRPDASKRARRTEDPGLLGVSSPDRRERPPWYRPGCGSRRPRAGAPGVPVRRVGSWRTGAHRSVYHDRRSFRGGVGSPMPSCTTRRRA